MIIRSITIESRVKLADTIILLDIPTDICLRNVYIRANESKKGKIDRDDIADGFDETLTEDFILFIKNFRNETLPRINTILGKYLSKDIQVLKSLEDVDAYVNSLSKI